jgi:hypothetical protein
MSTQPSAELLAGRDGWWVEGKRGWGSGSCQLPLGVGSDVAVACSMAFLATSASGLLG